MNNILFQDNLRTAERIEAARKAREKQINKGIFTAQLLLWNQR